MIFNFTGVGSVHDKDASQSLSEAFNQPGVKDAYSEVSYQLGATGTAPQAPVTTIVST